MSFERITDPRTTTAIFRFARLYRAEWRSEAETDGGLDDWRDEVVRAQAEMFVRKIADPHRPVGELGMTWRLDQLEDEMGIPNGTQESLNDEERRDRICARLRAWRVPTAEAIRRIAQAFTGNDVQTYMDYVAHAIYIQFVGTTLPDNLYDIEAEIVRILPARIGIIYWRVSFLTWGDVEQSGVTWCQLEDSRFTWEVLEETEPIDLPTWAECLPEVWLAPTMHFTDYTRPPVYDPPIITRFAADGFGELGFEATWATNEACDAELDWGLDDTYGNTVSDPEDDNDEGLRFRAAVSGLRGNTEYHLRARVTGRVSGLETVSTTTVVASPGPPPPIISSPFFRALESPDGGLHIEMRCTWTTDVLANSRVEWVGVAGEGLGDRGAVDGPDNVTTRNININLLPQTTYDMLYISATSPDPTSRAEMELVGRLTPARPVVTHFIGTGVAPPVRDWPLVTSTSIDIGFNTNRNVDFGTQLFVEYGLAADALNLRQRGDRFGGVGAQVPHCRATLTGLQPNTTYFWVCGMLDDDTLIAGRTPTVESRTTPPPAPPTIDRCRGNPLGGTRPGRYDVQVWTLNEATQDVELDWGTDTNYGETAVDPRDERLDGTRWIFEMTGQSGVPHFFRCRVTSRATGLQAMLEGEAPVTPA